jgi:hypothetical protein
MLNYLESAKKQFSNYKALGEKAIAQMGDEALTWQANEDSNSVTTIIQHLWGNMLSRWTDFLTTDGEKPWRERDAEFESGSISREAIMKKWNEGWECLFLALDSLNEGDLTRTIYIRNEPHSVLEAINRQLTHYAYHVGQIVFLAKMHSKQEWNSLSIPKNKSKGWTPGH